MSDSIIRPHPEFNRPFTHIPGDEREAPQEGSALCLSGGGYRAMLFHLGSLWRLNEAGWLRRLHRVSSVSGGSIVAARLALRWNQLGFDGNGVAANFDREVVQPVRTLAGRSIDARAVIGGFGLGTAADRIEGAYDKWLFDGATLQDLPDDPPRFVINAMNVQSGALWRFSKPYMGDYRVGLIPKPKTSLAKAVAASSAFPPILSPVELEVNHTDFTPGSGMDLQRPPFTTDIVLTDGGVYDNLGLETAWKRYTNMLVSNAGGALEAEEHPKHDWARHAVRVLLLIDNQVRSLRVRQLIHAYQDDNEPHTGAYWGIRTDIADYKLGDALPCPHAQTLELAATPTRLKALPDDLQERIINWGYAICDAAMRKWNQPTIAVPTGFPYRRGV